MITEAQALLIARTCHEANRFYCEGIGDNSQLPWHKAPAWQQDSAIAGVKFHYENPGAGSKGSHESWMKQKLEDGWVWGQVKDAEAKTHPCIMPYSQLPESQQVKDHIFVSICRAFFFAFEGAE